MVSERRFAAQLSRQLPGARFERQAGSDSRYGEDEQANRPSPARVESVSDLFITDATISDDGTLSSKNRKVFSSCVLTARVDCKPSCKQRAIHMQAAQDPDWTLVQNLYLAGQTPKEIEAKTGVKADNVSVRATRKGWTRALQVAKQTLQGLTGPAKAESESESKLSGSSERTRARLARLVERSAEKIEEMTLRSPAHALRVNGELESVVRNAKTVFGWTENQSAPAIRIGVLAQVTIQPASAPEPSQSQPVIEVESTPVSVTEVGPIHDKS